MACSDSIFLVDVCTKTTQPFSGTPEDVEYYPHALALSDDDALLVVGCDANSACGYDTASRTRLWIHKTASEVGAVCILGACVLVTVYVNPLLVLDRNTGERIASLRKADGFIFGMGAIDGFCFILS